MTILQSKIDFAVIFRVTNANPNGDPLNGNRPRTDYSNYGEMSDVSLKRKIRDRLLEGWIEAGRNDNDGNMVFVQSDDRKDDDIKNLRERARIVLDKHKSLKEATRAACARWIDVRAFGQVFPFKGGGGKKGKDADNQSDGDTGISIGIRGPVTIQSAFSVTPVEVNSSQITKSTSLEGDGIQRQSDQMGMKHRLDGSFIYVTYGSINPQLAEKTGFSVADAETIKTVLPRLFENDESAARQAGSMQILKVIWWKHNCKAGQYSSARVHATLDRNRIKSDGSYELTKLDNLQPEEIDGF